MPEFTNANLQTVAVGQNVLFNRLKYNKSFYCAEFVKYVLDKSKVRNNLPEPIKPEDFKGLECAKVIYEGLLRNYIVPEKNIINIENYKVISKNSKKLSVV